MTKQHAQQLYDYMMAVTAAGWYLPIEDRYGDVEIHCPQRDDDGYPRTTERCSSLDSAKTYLGEEGGYEKAIHIGMAREHNWKPLEPFRLKEEPLPVGMTVKSGDRNLILKGVADFHKKVRSHFIDTDTGGNVFAYMNTVTPVFTPTGESKMSHEEMIEELKRAGKIKPGMILNK